MKSEILECVSHYNNSCTKALKTFAPEYYVVQKNVKVDWAISRSTHRGGLYAKGPGMNLAGNSFLKFINSYKKHGIVYFQEYKSYEKDPIIGSAFADKWETYVGLVVGHEAAHAAQYYTENVRKLPRSVAHGDFFKKIYNIIRMELNKELPDQFIKQKEYQDLLKSIRKIEYAT